MLLVRFWCDHFDELHPRIRRWYYTLAVRTDKIFSLIEVYLKRTASFEFLVASTNTAMQEETLEETRSVHTVSKGVLARSLAKFS